MAQSTNKEILTYQKRIIKLNPDFEVEVKLQHGPSRTRALKNVEVMITAMQEQGLEDFIANDLRFAAAVALANNDGTEKPSGPIPQAFLGETEADLMKAEEVWEKEIGELESGLPDAADAATEHDDEDEASATPDATVATTAQVTGVQYKCPVPGCGVVTPPSKSGFRSYINAHLFKTHEVPFPPASRVHGGSEVTKGKLKKVALAKWFEGNNLTATYSFYPDYED